MTLINALSNWLTDVLIYLANGVLSIVYMVAELLPTLFSMAAALAILLLLDRSVQGRANFRPLRSSPQQIPPEDEVRPRLIAILFPPGQGHTSQWITLGVLGLWLTAQAGMAPPVPWIGVGMWGIGLLVLLVTPEHQRLNLLWFVKSGIALYAGLVILSRLYLGYTSHIAAQEWSRWIGSSAAAAQVIQTTRGNVTTILLWVLWLIAPLGYVSLLVQQLLVNPLNLVGPRAGAEDLLRRLRRRQ